MTLISDDSIELNNQLRANIVAFNDRHFNTKRVPLGFKVMLDERVVAGINGNVFGHWLLINWLWCDETTRGNGLATQLLNALELAAKERGAKISQLDTLDFQAKPFYEKKGYSVKYQMDNYPLGGSRYFMEKVL